MVHKQKELGFLWIVLGICFLWDPIVGLADCLPDLIGWLLVCIGVSALADMNEDLAAAQQSFRRMLWVALGRVAAELLIYVFLNKTTDQLNPYETPVWTLLLAFSFSVLELWLLIPAFRSFWRGVATLSECGGARNGLATPDRHGRSFCDRMLIAMTAFLILHAAATVLPELSVLTVFLKEGVYNTAIFRYRRLFRTVAALLSGVAGAVLLAAWWRFYARLRGETAWLDSLRARYEREILPNTGLRLGRRLGAGFAFFRIGILLSANIAILFYEFLPDWGSVLVVLCGCLILGGTMQGGSMLIGVGLSLTVVGVPRTLLNVRYLQSFVPRDSLYLPEAYERYFPVCVLASIEAVLTALFVGCLLLCVLRMEKRFVLQGDAISRMTAERDLRSHKKRAIPILCFTALSAAAKVAEIFLQPRYGWIWLVQFALSMVVFVLFCGLLTGIEEAFRGAYPAMERVER